MKKALPIQETEGDVISSFRAISSILIGTLLMIVLFLILGKTFIWPKYENVTQKDWQLQNYMAKVKADPNNAQNRLGLGYGYFQNGNYNAALNEYKKVLQLDSKNFSAYLNLGYTYQEMGKYARSEDSLQKAIELEPKNFEAHYALGTVYYKTKQYEQAATEFDKSFVLSPNVVNPLYYQGLCSEKLGRPHEAKAFFEQVLNYDPTNKLAKKALARIDNLITQKGN